MGAFIPILASYLNIKIIDFISSKYDHQITAKFNAAQFFIKSIFVISLMFIFVQMHLPRRMNPFKIWAVLLSSVCGVGYLLTS